MKIENIIEPYFRELGIDYRKERNSKVTYILQSGEREAHLIFPEALVDPFEVDAILASPEGKFVIYATEVTPDSLRNIVEDLTKTLTAFLRGEYTVQKKGLFIKHVSLRFREDLVFDDAIMSRR